MTNPPPGWLEGMESDDALIVRRVCAGDREAFALLVDRHHARCLRVATHLLGDADEADDVVQEAFVRAYRGLAGYREQDRFGAWLTRIVVNQCRTASARSRRWARLDDAEEHEAHDTVAAIDRRREVANALALLGPEQREAVVLRFADQLSYEEMASITGVGISALKMRVQRACARLRALLSDHSHV